VDLSLAALEPSKCVYGTPHRLAALWANERTVKRVEVAWLIVQCSRVEGRKSLVIFPELRLGIQTLDKTNEGC